MLSTLYSLPNLYPKDPAVQVSANRGGKIDAALVSRVDGLLKTAQVPSKSIAIEDETLVVRLREGDAQATASNLLGDELGPAYTVALNLASTVPQWLQNLWGKSMALGLDLQGGVHFLLEVDEQAAIEKRSEGYVDEVRAVLREAQVPIATVTRSGTSIRVQLRNAGDVARAKNLIAASAPELTLANDTAAAEAIVAVLPKGTLKSA
jgi:preprotein translocase subunit SecD